VVLGGKEKFEMSGERVEYLAIFGKKNTKQQQPLSSEHV
jgi:hypothetical protein